MRSQALRPEVPLLEDENAPRQQRIGSCMGSHRFADSAVSDQRPGIEKTGQNTREPELAMQKSKSKGGDPQAEPRECLRR